MSTSSPPLLNVGKGGNGFCFRRELNISRSAVSTISDIVRPCRAASRLSSAMTVSSILRVVFIWKSISLVWVYGNPGRDTEFWQTCSKPHHHPRPEYQRVRDDRGRIGRVRDIAAGMENVLQIRLHEPFLRELPLVGQFDHR